MILGVEMPGGFFLAVVRKESLLLAHVFIH